MADRIDTLKQFLEEDPEDSFLYFALAQEYEKQNLHKAALDTYYELQERDPQYVGLYYHLANVEKELVSKEKALETYEEGIEVAKKQSDFHALSELMNARTNLEIE